MTGLTARSAIEVAGLCKSFGDQVVLDGIDLEVAEGTVFALLGPNGAGKTTTTVQVLSTLIGADGGQARVAGHDLPATRTRSARRSASPARAPRPTTCSAARRTCG
jgi:ABC-2 type transport system ATP-binding protein